MNLQELNSFAIAGRIDEVNLISLEGGIYLLEARMHGAAYPLNDSHGKTLHLRSVEHARDMLEGMPKVLSHLIHTSVHDEMCGMPASAEENLKVPIALHSAG